MSNRIEEQYPGSRPTPYTTIVNAEGRLSCNCNGWVIKKGAKPRWCKHCDFLVGKHGLTCEQRGDYFFVVQMGRVKVPAPSAGEGLAPIRAAVDAHQQGFVAPMLACPMPEDMTIDRFDPRDWAMEEKYDGHRVIVAIADLGGETAVRAWSRPAARSGNRIIARELPVHVRENLKWFPVGTYDGELIIPGGMSHNVVDAALEDRAQLVLFDVMKLLGRDVTREPYTVRRSYLVEIFKRASKATAKAVTLAAQLMPSMKEVERIWKRGGEGGILKRRSAPYQPGRRSPDLVKVKKLQETVVTVIGFEAGECGPYSKVLVVDGQGRKTSVKTLNSRELRKFAEEAGAGTGHAALVPKHCKRQVHPAIGRRLRIKFTDIIDETSYRHPRWKGWETKGGGK